MKKIIHLTSVLLCMLFILSGMVCTEAATFAEKSVKVVNNGSEDGELVLRFYQETPNVPYIGMREYSQYMKQQPLSIREREDGIFAMENSIGETLLCDPDLGRIVIPDWNRFFDLPLPLENEAKGWKDTSARFARITHVEYKGEPECVELDFSKYHIRIYADENDIYLPVSVMSNIMTDIAANHLLYNGEKLFAQRIDLVGRAAEGFFAAEGFAREFGGQARPSDIVKQCYADLCFNIDYFFGHPGIAMLDEAIDAKGLDQALKDLGEEGKDIRDGLLSPDLPTYIAAMDKLFTVYLNDGHTVFTSTSSLIMDPYVQSNFDIAEKLLTDTGGDHFSSFTMQRQSLNMLISMQRADAWGGDTYLEYGSTAVIRLDSFMLDEPSWENYYKGAGDFPQDGLGTAIAGLQKASENPEIENIIFDVSCNGGGSPDVMMAILALTTGQNELYGVHKLTGQEMTFTFEVDTNFDGVFDEKDKETKYNYNYGVLTTRYSFSCGNLFPIIMQEGGAVVIGENPSGGSCCIQIGSDAEGFEYMMSSAQWQLTDSEGKDVEGGCRIDLPIEAGTVEDTDALSGLYDAGEEIPSFRDFFDAALLDQMMNDRFRDKAERKPAA